VILGALLIHNSWEEPAEFKPQSRPSVVATTATATSKATAPTKSPPAVRALPRSAPERLRIPEIAVNAPFTGLSIGESGRLDTPPADDPNLVGWFRDGPSPGERGSAIVVGHVDTKRGPAVFVHLGSLRPGSTIHITRKDGTVATFEVDSVHLFSKEDFPDDRVYADTSSPELRLITCGGAYDRKAGQYTANVVVFAHLDAAKPA
jgi:sortase (surface protein transpeptidase)